MATTGGTSHAHVEAELLPRSPHPYSSVAISPDGHHAVVAGRDTLRTFSVGSNDFMLQENRFFRVAQHFHSPAMNTSTNTSTNTGHNRLQQQNLRDVFNAHSLSQSQHGPATGRADVTITDLAWSSACTLRDDGAGGKHQIYRAAAAGSREDETDAEGSASLSAKDTNDSLSSELEHISNMKNSLIAASASNGSVVIWQANRLFPLGDEGSSLQNNSWNLKKNSSGRVVGQPEAIFAEHSRAVNRLAWHPTKYGLLLTASQDSTVKLWDRKGAANDKNDKEPQRDVLSLRSLFGLSPQSIHAQSQKSASASSLPPEWRCTATIKPKSDAVRDVKWSPSDDNIFAIVTASGYLIVYNLRLLGRPWLKIAVHSGEATCVDWHPRRKFILATASGRERSIKVWDLEEGLEAKNETIAEYQKVNSFSLRSDTSGEDQSDPSLEVEKRKSRASIVSRNAMSMSTAVGPPKTAMKRTMSATMIGPRSSPGRNIHTLHIAAPVTRFKWRPFTDHDRSRSRLTPASSNLIDLDAHEAMMIVSTAPISGAVGGNGSIELWTFHRPFLALSKVEGHEEGAVTDFVCLSQVFEETHIQHSKNQLMHSKYLWQHTLSVGRDGKCLIQNLARGHRPIDQVPASTFALGTLAPSKTLRGSLQIVSVNQFVPSGVSNDFLLTGLQRNPTLGTFPYQNGQRINKRASWKPKLGGEREPASTPVLASSIIDGFATGSIVEAGTDKIIVSPELQYLSYFARSYQFRVCKSFQTQSSVCGHNSKVAAKLDGYGPLARMWKLLSSMLDGVGGNVEQISSKLKLSRNALSNALWPTVTSLLLERADAGDVQTCVAICEVFDIVQPQNNGSNVSIRTHKLDIETIREWYSSYIDILHQMNLFSLATDLIRTCRDPAITILNQQSTTINESCPSCGKPLQNATTKIDSGNEKKQIFMTTQRACSSCRKKLGSCFVCHAPVKGFFVMCPGCGHGGHLQHAISWFQDLGETECPTGCGEFCRSCRVAALSPKGHKCNFTRQFNSSFPSDSTFICEIIEE